MQNILKSGLVSLSLIAMLGVLACQSAGSGSSRSHSPNRETTQGTQKPEEAAYSGLNTNSEQGMANAIPAAAPTNAPGAMLAAFMAYPTGDVGTSAILVENFVPAEVAVGQEFETKTTVTNLTSLTLDNVVLAQASFGDFKKTSSTPKPVVEGNNTTWTLGSLGPNESRVIRTTGSAGKAEPINTCVSVTYATSLCTNIPVVQPELLLVARGPKSASQCDDLEYEYTVSNPGSGAAKKVVVNAALPDGLTYNGKNSFSKTIGTLGSKKSETFSIKVDAARSGTFEHTAMAKAQSGLEAKAGLLATVVSKPVLTITENGAKTSFVGRNAKYNFTVKNIGDGVAKNIVLEDIIPNGAEYRSSTEGGEFAKGRLSWDLGDLRPNESRDVSVSLNLGSIGTFVSRATAIADCADAVSASVSTDVKGIPAVLLEVVDVEDPIAVGEEETYIITVTNQGTAPATGVGVAITLPDTTTLVRTIGSTAGPAAGVTVGKFSFQPLASLAPKKVATWKVVIRGTSAADARFRVSMTSDQLTSPVDETEATNFYE